VTGRKNSGISPIVATVILVAVAIVIAIAVAFWASGLVGVFTRFEKLEITSAIMIDEGTFQVRIRNTGSADTSIIQVVVQGKAVGEPSSPVPIRVGDSVVCTVTVSPSPPAGITVELAFYTAGGKTYPTAVLSTLGTGSGAWDPSSVTVNCGAPGGGQQQTVVTTTETAATTQTETT
jgi:flagellin-like protein